MNLGISQRNFPKKTRIWHPTWIKTSFIQYPYQCVHSQRLILRHICGSSTWLTAFEEINQAHQFGLERRNDLPLCLSQVSSEISQNLYLCKQAKLEQHQGWNLAISLRSHQILISCWFSMYQLISRKKVESWREWLTLPTRQLCHQTSTMKSKSSH